MSHTVVDADSWFFQTVAFIQFSDSACEYDIRDLSFVVFSIFTLQTLDSLITSIAVLSMLAEKTPYSCDMVAEQVRCSSAGLQLLGKWLSKPS